MNVTLIACFFLFDNMICWLDYRAYRILMKVSEKSYLFPCSFSQRHYCFHFSLTAIAANKLHILPEVRKMFFLNQMFWMQEMHFSGKRKRNNYRLRFNDTNCLTRFTF